MKHLFHLLMLSFTAGCTLATSPDEHGDYAKQFPTTPFSNQVCQVNEDCALSARRDGSCCDLMCSKKTALNKDTLAILEAHQGKICVEGGFKCAESRCDPESLNEERTAECVEGYCQAIPTPKLGKRAKASKQNAKRKAPKYKGGKQRPGKQRPGKRKVQKRP